MVTTILPARIIAVAMLSVTSLAHAELADEQPARIQPAAAPEQDADDRSADEFLLVRQRQTYRSLGIATETGAGHPGEIQEEPFYGGRLADPPVDGGANHPAWHAATWHRLYAPQRLPESNAAEKRRLAAVPRFDIPLRDHPLVEAYVDYFAGRGRKNFATWLERGQRYIPLMQPILEAAGLPRDLIYVAMVESGFSAQALSRAKAAGFWQFMRATGRVYHLRQDTWVDERRDFIRATEAAATMLSELYQRFDGDWHLAWAAYNGGWGRVERALSQTEGGDFWSLCTQPRGLAQETRHYVPKIIAAAIVAKNARQFGFEIPATAPLTFDEIQVGEATDLRAVARRFGIDIGTLRELNPALLHDVTPPGRKSTLRVPAGRGDGVARWLKGLPRQLRLTYEEHRVRPGETLYRIAARYRTSMTAVREFNGIRDPHALKPGMHLVIPKRAGNEPVWESSSSSSSSKRRAGVVSGSKPKHPANAHLVSRGDTLWSIAKHYGVSVDNLRRWNGRADDTIAAGEVLKVF